MTEFAEECFIYFSANWIFFCKTKVRFHWPAAGDKDGFALAGGFCQAETKPQAGTFSVSA